MATGDVLAYIDRENNIVDIEGPDGKPQRARLVVFSGDLTKNLEKSAFGELITANLEAFTGWSFAYNINPAAIRQTVLFGGIVSHIDNFAQISSGSDPNGVAFIRTEESMSYTPGTGARIRFTAIFSEPQAGATQLIGVGDTQDGWFFGYNGLEFGILRRSNGQDFWTKKSDWSEDTKPLLDTTKGNVYEINFQWLGFGAQYFSMENDNGDLELVHKIIYSNTEINTSVDIPSLPISMGVANNGVNTTPVTIKSPSASAFAEGEAFPRPFTALVGYDYPITSLPIGDNYLFSIRNPSSYEGKDNRLYLDPALLTLALDGTRAVTFRVLLNATLTGESFVDVLTGVTPAQVDTSAVAFSGGLEVLSLSIARNNTAILDLGALFDSRLWADSTLTLIATVDQTGSDVAVGFTFRSRI
jgi:hypothetical protein